MGTFREGEKQFLGRFENQLELGLPVADNIREQIVQEVVDNSVPLVRVFVRLGVGNPKRYRDRNLTPKLRLTSPDQG
jgi:hypothetical protein